MHPSGRVKPFSRYDDGGFGGNRLLVQGLIVARQYFQGGNRRAPTGGSVGPTLEGSGLAVVYPGREMSCTGTGRPSMNGG